MLESLTVTNETSQMNCQHLLLHTLTFRSKMHAKYGPASDIHISESIQLSAKGLQANLGCSRESLH